MGAVDEVRDPGRALRDRLDAGESLEIEIDFDCERLDTVVPLVVEWLRGRYLGTPHRHADGPVEVFLGRRPPPEAERMDT